MTETKYIHGYTREEQDRLVAQAEYFRHRLILPGLAYGRGERLLDVGCGVGAVLGVIASAFPGLRLAGIDLVPEQIAYAREHLAALGHADADLRHGDATRLPWEDGSFDHVFMMWFLEHVRDPRPFLAEARRVLRSGGTITIIETDYSMTHLLPPHPDAELLFDSQRELFRRHGNAMTGRSLGALLAAGGFERVFSVPVGVHRFTGDGGELRALVDYMLGFLEPMIPRMAEELAVDRARLLHAAQVIRALPDQRVASFTQIVFRATGFR
jgi:ubiquinone/menaquinone biosynthesis C-methylase UbiE